MDSKRCPCCTETKPLDSFRKRAASDDGRQIYCKPCQVLKNKEWRERNREIYRKGRREYKRRARKGPRGDRIREQGAEWVRTNREKRRAHKAVWTAVARGVLIRPECCERCGRVGVVNGHHEDYSTPLVVQWLCHVCHEQRHREMSS